MLQGKLHTGRSRNDQVALDMRLFVKDAIGDTVALLRGGQSALLEQAEANLETVMPGYTHVQRAQPVLLAHHLLAYFEMAQRDAERFQGCLERTDILPLGAGALAGVTYPIDREFVAQELGFSKVSRNSMDAVADRDFVVEYHSAAATTMMHLSRVRRRAGLLVFRGVRLRYPGRRLHHRQQHHAPEAQPGRGRARPGQDRPGGTGT